MNEGENRESNQIINRDGIAIRHDTETTGRRAKNDYEVNLKAEPKILRLHERLDELHKGEWKKLLEIQE